MKRLHLVLLLVGVLAVGSAFTTKPNHRDPCEGKTLVHRVSNTVFVPISDPGSCMGNGDCIYADLDDNGTGDIPCNYEAGTFVPAP